MINIKMFAVEPPLEQGHRHAPVGSILRPAGAKRFRALRGWVGRWGPHGLAVVVAVLLRTTVGWTQPAPPAGMQWQQTFDDEYNSLDTSKWNCAYAQTLWCGAEPNVVPGGPGGCAQNCFGVSIVGGVLQLAGAPNQSNFANTTTRAVLNTSGKFAQRYGYFEWRAQMPHDASGEGDGLWPGLWFLPVGKADQSGGGCCHEESDLLEMDLSTTNMSVGHFTIHDSFVNEFSVNYPNVSAGNLSLGYHTYGLWWKQDASPHGTMCNYFDGIQQACHTLTAPDTLWDNGIYLLEQVIPCPPNNQGIFNGAPCTAKTSSNNPMFVDYTRVWRLIPTNATPTPTPTPTSGQSPYCTTITTVGPTIIDAFGNTWSLTPGANVAENGITDTSTFNVVKLVYNFGYIYQQNTAGNWYRRNANVGWVGVAAPACGSSTPPPGTLGWTQTTNNTVTGAAKIIISVPIGLTGKLFLDNTWVAFTPPSTWQWDTTKVANGSHTIREDDVDTNGTVISTSSTTVNIAN